MDEKSGPVFLDDEARLEASYADYGIVLDPILNAIPASGGPSDISSTNDQSWNSTWNTNLENQISFPGHHQLQHGAAPGVNHESRQQSNTSTATSTTNRTRTSSPNSNSQTRKRSMASSRSSVPTPNSPPDRKQQASKVRQQPPRQRKPPEKMPVTSARKKQVKQENVKEEQEMEETNTKRNRFLERNRVAASKCRQKKKEWVNDLEETKQELENQHSALTMEASSLQLELMRMKTQLMEHANCNDPNINLWIDNEARTFVQNTARRDLARPCMTGSVGYLDRNGPIIQHSQANSMGTHLPSPNSRDEEINFDHMPDGMFDDEHNLK
ncbi:Fc.00g046750.m01.CDS01 [Cosmosporella sp. VM-42]